MRAAIGLIGTALLATSSGLWAQETQPSPSPGEIVAAAPRSEWRAIDASDLLVMDLAPDARGRARRVVIQLMPPPFSQSWIGNIRRLAAAHWWDGMAITRVQDNYVVQWGDPNGEDAAKAKALPARLHDTVASQYTTPADDVPLSYVLSRGGRGPARLELHPAPPPTPGYRGFADSYVDAVGFVGGFPMAVEREFRRPPPGVANAGEIVPTRIWPVHCYAMVGVGRNMSPDAGTGAELYTVIGHAPRHLDRNIALVGRVIEGIEHLSSLPRGTGALGFYETPEERTAITAIRLGNEITALPTYEYLDTSSESFTRYLEARANRRDPFFITPAGGADICNSPVPVRRVPAG